MNADIIVGSKYGIIIDPDSNAIELGRFDDVGSFATCGRFQIGPVFRFQNLHYVLRWKGLKLLL